MKKTDIAMIIFIAGVGVLIAYFVVINLPFLKLPEDGVKVQTMDALTSDVAEISKDVFNQDAINPTVEVIIVGDSSAQPQ